VGDDLSDRLCPTRSRRLLATQGREPIAAAGRLTLVLGRTSLSAAGLAVTPVYDIVALSATNAAGFLLVCVRLRTMGRLSETRSAAVAATEVVL
jgi:hypothetical protein